MPTLANVRGTVDVLPAESASNQRIYYRLKGFLESYGYKPIDVPLIEHTDLFLTKSGEDIISKMYSFSFKNRNLCLRPEFTASIGRAFVNHLQGTPLPLRLYYHGPVFRYEKPQKGRYRQFNQMGIEVMGAGGALADAEVIHCACSGFEALGLTDYQLVIGHIGVVMELLRAFDLDRRARDFLLQNMDSLGKEGKGIEAVTARLDQLYPPGAAGGELSALADSLAQAGPSVDVNMLEMFGHMTEEEARLFLRDFLAHMEIGVGIGGREPEEIVERLLRKLRQKDASGRIRQALRFLDELNRVAGPRDSAMAEVERLIERYGLRREVLAPVEQLMSALDLYGIDWERVTINLAMGRGLQYYTGMIFEAYHGGMSTENQLCGGGRYDDLIHALGGRETPACGFSYGMERLRLAIGGHDDVPASQVLVIAVGEADRAEALRLADELRGYELRVETDVRDRGVKGNLQYADKTDVPFCLILGEREREAGTFVLRDMRAQQETSHLRTDLSNVAQGIRRQTERPQDEAKPW